MRNRLALLPLLMCCRTFSASASPPAVEKPPQPAESLWIEAEHLDGIRGHCWPMGRPEMKKTDGHWGLSGPGWAAEWNMGGESGFLSIAAGADDDRAVASKDIEIPTAGPCFVWVRYGDWREKSERFQVRIEQPGAEPWVGQYGQRPMVDEDNEMKLYWGWVFVWDHRPADLKKGPAKLSLVSAFKEPVPRQVDVIVLTTDPAYRPQIKERPRHPTRDVLAGYRRAIPAGLKPLAKNRPAWDLPPAWRLRSFHDRGFLYLWNISHDKPAETWLGDRPGRVKFPYHVADDETRKQFENKYGGHRDVPIFSDPRIVPAFHGVGPSVFATDAQTGQLGEAGRRFARWLDEHPGRPWATMMNYHPDNPIGREGIAAFEKYRDRYVGSIAGESLGYFSPDGDAMEKAVSGRRTRRQLVEAFTPVMLAANAAKYRKVFGRDLDKNPYADVISCLSQGNMAFAPLCSLWGADHRLRVHGLHFVAVGDAVGVPARGGPAERLPHRHLPLLQLRRRLDDLQQCRQLPLAAGHPGQLLFGLLRGGHDLVQDGHLVPVHGRLVDVLPRAGF